MSLGIKKYYLLFSILYFFFQINEIATKSPPKKAICILTPDKNSSVFGNVTFSQSKDYSAIRVDYNIHNIKGVRGFHIHEFPNITGGCDNAGGHYNPANTSHAGPHDLQKHIGDFGNLVANDNLKKIKYTSYYFGTSMFGEYSIVNRTCVLHAGVDDLGYGRNAESKKNGNAGKRLASGILYEYPMTFKKSDNKKKTRWRK